MTQEDTSEHSVYKDRRQAGRHLARKLLDYSSRPDVVVLGLPRGGVPVAYEIACRLNAPLDVFVVRKLGVPGNEELAFGAIAHNGVTVFNKHISQTLTQESIDKVVQREKSELLSREHRYRGTKPFPQLIDRSLIVVDDGLATGASMRVAVKALRQYGPANIIVAVPVAPPETCEWLQKVADQVVCSITPRPFHGVGRWYDDFSQTTDQEVISLLNDAIQLRQ